MFGLDARIALAIFGALSVISGAALYSAIQEANTEKYRQSLQEIAKASEQYYLDNGKPLAVENTSLGRVYLADLVTNRESLNTWNGPYHNSTQELSTSIKNSITNDIHEDAYMLIMLHKKSTWASNLNLTSETCLDNNPDCTEWITIYAGNSVATSSLLNIFNNLDRSIDNGDGALAGKVRYNLSADDYLMYQGITRRK
jgi:type II secretory pathway pseudopilin PulG